VRPPSIGARRCRSPSVQMPAPGITLQAPYWTPRVSLTMVLQPTPKLPACQTQPSRTRTAADALPRPRLFLRAHEPRSLGPSNILRRSPTQKGDIRGISAALGTLLCASFGRLMNFRRLRSAGEPLQSGIAQAFSIGMTCPVLIQRSESGAEPQMLPARLTRGRSARGTLPGSQFCTGPSGKSTSSC
jgi:hypothetical protein